jgi:hypothetical protein
MKKIIYLFFITIFSLQFSSAQTLTTKRFQGTTTIIYPSIGNFIKILEMGTSDFISDFKDIGYNSGSPYTTAKTGYTLMSKGEVSTGGSNHVSKMGKSKILFEWYHRDNDIESVFNDVIIELEDNIVTSDNNTVLYYFTYRGRKYRALLLSGGSQIGFLIERNN